MKTVTLRKFEELAINAHRWISFDSKKRAETIILQIGFMHLKNVQVRQLLDDPVLMCKNRKNE